MAANTLTWVLRRAWLQSKRLTALLCLLTAVRSLVPASLALVAKGFVDTLTLHINTERSADFSVLGWLVLALALGLAAALSSASRAYVAQRLADELNASVAARILRTAAQLELIEFQDRHFQNITERAARVNGERFTGVINNLFDTLSNTVQLVSLLVILSYIVPWTGPFLALVAPPFLLSQWRLSHRRYALHAHRSERRRWQKYYASLLMQYPAVAESRLLGISSLLVDRYSRICREFKAHDKRLLLSNWKSSCLFSSVMAVGSGLLLYDLALRALANSATLGDVAVFFAASSRLRGLTDAGVRSLAGLRHGLMEVADLVSFLERRRASEAGGNQLVDWGCRGHIRFHEVDFAYPGATRQALSNISFEIRPGECVALVGENGSGKSTLAHLVAGLYRPTGGRIFLDGRKLDALKRDSVRQHIAYVFQHPTHYEGSAQDNIAFGNWPACLADHHRARAAAIEAGANTLIESLPRGYDTKLGRLFGDHDLSGGQWQKLAFARAVARNASLLILDEPTATLDLRSERQLLTDVKRMAAGRSTLLISHPFLEREHCRPHHCAASRAD